MPRMRLLLAESASVQSERPPTAFLPDHPVQRICHGDIWFLVSVHASIVQEVRPACFGTAQYKG